MTFFYSNGVLLAAFHLATFPQDTTNNENIELAHRVTLQTCIMITGSIRGWDTGCPDGGFRGFMQSVQTNSRTVGQVRT